MKPKVSPGDLYQLGKHRILCGDSQDTRMVRRIVGRRKVRMLFAGPPYFNQRAYCSWDDYASYLDSMRATLRACVRLLGDGSVVTWLIGRGSSEQKDHASYHSILLEEHGLRFQDAIAWIKPGANYTIKRSCHIRMNGYYYPAFKWETLFVYRKPGRMPKMGSRERSLHVAAPHRCLGDFLGHTPDATLRASVGVSHRKSAPLHHGVREAEFLCA